MEGIKMLKDFSVGSRTVFGSLLMVLFLISGCASNNNSYYGKISTNPGTTGTASLIGVIAAHMKTNAYSVPRKDRDKHEQCVYFTLENLFLGERCDWYSSNGVTKGQVQVVSYQPAG
jgi:surface antigen